MPKARVNSSIDQLSSYHFNSFSVRDERRTNFALKDCAELHTVNMASRRRVSEVGTGITTNRKDSLSARSNNKNKAASEPTTTTTTNDIVINREASTNATIAKADGRVANNKRRSTNRSAPKKHEGANEGVTAGESTSHQTGTPNEPGYEEEPQGKKRNPATSKEKGVKGSGLGMGAASKHSRKRGKIEQRRRRWHGM